MTYICRWIKLDGSTAGYVCIEATNRIHARRLLEKENKGIIITEVIPSNEFDEDSLWK